jgi:hypothetical protein
VPPGYLGGVFALTIALALLPQAAPEALHAELARLVDLPSTAARAKAAEAGRNVTECVRHRARPRGSRRPPRPATMPPAADHPHNRLRWKRLRA